jgi:hypothetical protein
MALIDAAEVWITRAWREMGASADAHDVPVAQFRLFDIDDLGHPFKNVPLATWRLVSGQLVPDLNVELHRVPYIAFFLSEEKLEMGIQVQWASRCGYGYTIRFGSSGDPIEEKVRWIS